jgi:hypothetical protein
MVIKGSRHQALSEKQLIEEWITLAHVSRRWRSVVFRSPLRLNLRLLCSRRTRARDILDIWPPLPLIIRDVHVMSGYEPSSVDYIIAALERNNRVRQIDLGCLSSSELEYVTDSAAMHKPFPELTHLRLGGFGRQSILFSSFLGGTAPRLQSLSLSNAPFPELPKLLLSGTNLVHLSHYNIPRSGYISPEAVATSLSALTNVESLCFQFRCPRPRPAPESRRPPPPPLTRSILPSLIKIESKGAGEYLEEILARIDAPRLTKMHITLFNEIVFDLPQFFQFISRRPTLRAQEKGHITFSPTAITIRFPPQTSDYGVLSVNIPCTAPDWQLSALEQLCSSSLPTVSTLEDLYVFEDLECQPGRFDSVENTLWLELLHPFAAVKNIYLCKKSVLHIAPAMQELVGARTTEVLPTLENIFLEGLQPSGPLHSPEGHKKVRCRATAN